MSVTVNWESKDFAETLVGYGEYHILKHCVYDPTALFYLGEIEGKSLLDLGCGEGHFGRLAKLKGASRVVSVDVSPVMIKMSKQLDVDRLCEYLVGNIHEIGNIGEFDYVTANLVLPYVTKFEDLLSMCRCFYDNLKPGGRFLGNSSNCLKSDYNWGKSLEKYGIESYSRLSKMDNMWKYELTLTPGNQKQYKTIAHFFEPQVYENAFLQSGFRSFNFKPPYCSEETTEKYPEKFWDDYFANPYVICYVADK